MSEPWRFVLNEEAKKTTPPWRKEDAKNRALGLWLALDRPMGQDGLHLIRQALVCLSDDEVERCIAKLRDI